MTATAPANRVAPWDVMSGTFELEHPDVAHALAATGTDYEVEVRDLYSARYDVATSKHADFIQAPNLRTVVRPMPDGTEKVLGAVGRRWSPIHNADAFSVADTLVKDSGAVISGAADYRSGAASLLVVDLRRPVVLTLPGGTKDVTDLQLIMKNSHDGSGALTFALTGVRLACTNMLQAAVAGAERVWKISHTPRADERVNLAHQSIIKALAYRDAFEDQAQAMVAAAMTDLEFERMVERLWPIPEDAKSDKAGDRRREIHGEVMHLYRESETIGDARGTLWGGYNALTEWHDWARVVHNGEAARAEGSLEGVHVRAKMKLWETFSSAAA